MPCTHPTYSTSEPRPYVGSVARDEHRAAHGGIEVTETCAACGARRRVNLNGLHREEGVWGATRAERQQAAQAASAHARTLIAAVEPLVLGAITASLDAEAMVVIEGPGHERVRALPGAWVDQARAARKAVEAAQAAAANV